MPSQVLPPEWAPQAGVLLAWPHAATDWRDQLAAVGRTYVALAREIARRERLLVVCPNQAELDAARARLLQEGVDASALRLAIAATDDTWMRDYGPLTVFRNQQPKLLDFRFDGWDGRYPAAADDALTRTLHQAGLFGDVELESLAVVLEGGSVEVDGAGTAMTTRRCLLATDRNPGWTQAGWERGLRDWLGVERVLWLAHGWLAGDDTDGHVDMLARFCAADTIAYTTCADPDDVHYAPLAALAAELAEARTATGAPYRLVALPLPAPIHDAAGQRLPASYANFLIIDGAVLVPVYGDPNDALALERLAAAFPEREIVGIDCRSLIQQYGSLHCVTMQLPAGVRF